MQFLRGADLGLQALKDRAFVETLLYRQRFDFSASALAQEYVVDLFNAPEPAYTMAIFRLRVEFADPVMQDYWRSVLAVDGVNPDGVKALDFRTGETTDLSEMPVNGVIPREAMEGEFEFAYLVRPSSKAQLVLRPNITPHANLALNPVGRVFVLGGKLQ